MSSDKDIIHSLLSLDYNYEQLKTLCENDLRHEILLKLFIPINYGTLDKPDYNNILESVLINCEQLEKLLTSKSHIYFSGEFDSNQTRFEKDSNNLEIGVIAKSSIVGASLLHLLRIIIDQNVEIIDMALDEILDNNDPICPITIMRSFSSDFESYGSDFKLNEKFTSTLICYDFNLKKSVETIIEKYINDVDIWTLSRISNAC
jgi:hypothetical protein